MTDQEKIEAERQELNLLIQGGMHFDVERTMYVRSKGIFGRFRKPAKTVEKLTLTIQEPTLSTLDRIAAEQIEIRIDEQAMTSEMWLNEANKLAALHSKRMAKIIAIAVLGENCVTCKQHGQAAIYTDNTKEIEDMTELILHGVKPSKLVSLCLMINTMSNLGDFMSSTRLMSASRTTMPILVGESKED